MAVTIHALQTTNPNQSGITTSVEPSPELIAELTKRLVGLDLDAVEATPDDTVTVPDSDGGWIAIGEEDGWLTAVAHGSDDTEAWIYEGESISDLAAAIARISRPADA